VQVGAGAQQLLELHIAALELIQSAYANRGAHTKIGREAINAAIRTARRREASSPQEDAFDL